MSLDERRKNEERVFTNIGTEGTAADPLLDDNAPKFGGVLASDYHYMLSQHKKTQDLESLKKSIEDNEIQQFRMKSFRAAQAPTVLLAAKKEKAVPAEVPVIKISAKKRKVEAALLAESCNSVDASSLSSKSETPKAIKSIPVNPLASYSSDELDE